MSYHVFLPWACYIGQHGLQLLILLHPMPGLQMCPTTPCSQSLSVQLLASFTSADWLQLSRLDVDQLQPLGVIWPTWFCRCFILEHSHAQLGDHQKLSNYSRDYMTPKPKVFTVGPSLKAFALPTLGGLAEHKAALPHILISHSLAEAGILGYPGSGREWPAHHE